MVRKATNKDFDSLKKMSSQYTKITRRQAYMYCSVTGNTERFVFRDTTIIGVTKALDHMLDMLNEVSK